MRLFFLNVFLNLFLSFCLVKFPVNAQNWTCGCYCCCYPNSGDCIPGDGNGCCGRTDGRTWAATSQDECGGAPMVSGLVNDCSQPQSNCPQADCTDASKTQTKLKFH